MGQSGEQTELQKKIAAELREKSMRTAQEEGERPDFVEDSVYQRGTKKTTGLLFVWFLVFVAIGVVVYMSLNL